MPSLYDALKWTRLQVAGTAAAPSVGLAVGDVGNGGPLALLIAGTHGDEGPWSALAIRSVLERSTDELRGRLRVVFTANPLAAQAVTRNAPIDTPNCVDLDGTFPGSDKGSHSERLAAQLAPLVAEADIVLDLHGGGSWCVNAFTKEFEGSEDLVASFGAPFHRAAPDKAGGLTTYARAQGAKVINIEVGGRGLRERQWEAQIAEGVVRILADGGVLRPATPPAPAPKGTPVGPTVALRSDHAGIFVPEVGEDAVGTLVDEGTVLARVLDLTTLEELEVLRAPFGRTAMMLLRPHVCAIEAGALLYALAEPL